MSHVQGMALESSKGYMAAPPPANYARWAWGGGYCYVIAAIARSCHSGLVLVFSRASKYISFCNSSFCWSWSFLFSSRGYACACSSWSARVSFLVVRGIWWAPPNFTIVFEASSSTDCFLVAVSFAFRHDFTGIHSCDCLIFLDGTPSVRAICFPLDDFLYLLYSHHAFTGHLLRAAAPYRSPFEVLSCLIQGIFNIFGVSELVFSTVTAFYRLPWPWWVFVLSLGFLGGVSALAGASSSSVCHLCTR